MLAWHRQGMADLLILRLDRSTSPPSLKSLQPAPNDLETLRIRSGVDSRLLSSKRVVVFGVGSVGSHSALTLAECGIGNVTLVDGDLLRPGNVVRHVGGTRGVGYGKVWITEQEITEHAPWTVASSEFASPSGPEAIGKCLEHCDAAVDATGHWPFQQLIPQVADASGVPLVSGALYRGGAVARVCRQAPGDPRLWERSSAQGHLEIPAGREEDEYRLETGCASPVSNAPPSSVLALAATISQVTCDLLTARMTYPAEITDVYRTLDAQPFDRIARLTWPAS